ncbi:MAG: (2Fe-2S)-binding protein [Pseudomonadota bacterium]
MTRQLFKLHINDRLHEIEADPGMPLLWVLRDLIGLTGTKYSCGIGACGTCLVHIDGKAVTSCTLPVADAAGRHITTIEGLSDTGDHPVQRAWRDERVPQCGYCQSGQIMAAAALLAETAAPDDNDIDRAMSRVLCRCGTYPRVRRAIQRAAHDQGDAPS